jgi:hypothetical protein
MAKDLIMRKLKLEEWRDWRFLQRAGMALLAVAAVTFGVMAVAGATGPTEGTSVPDSAVPIGTTFTAGTPFSSGQQIDVVVPANGVFTSTTQNINILECSAPNGVIPTQPTACDGNTINGNTLDANADGSFNYQTFTGAVYTVYALPDKLELGENSSGNSCGNTAATECILYIGVNQADFTQPHVWSQPFSVNPATGADVADNGTDPGDGTLVQVPAEADPNQSTVVASPATATADGVDASTVTVTLLGTTGTTSGIPVPQKTVTLTQQSGGHSIITPAESPSVTNAAGQVTFTVTDSTAEGVTYTATDTTDGVAASSPNNQPTVQFQAPVVSTTHSTVGATPAAAPADGVTTTTITVTLRDQAPDAQPVAGKSVTLTGTGSAQITPNTAVTTNASGVATFTATDTATEAVTFSATDTSDQIPLTSTAGVTFGSLAVSATKSTVTAQSPANVTTTQGSKVVVTLLAANGNAVAGRAVTLTASPSSTAVISAPSAAMTGSDGEVTFVVTDTVAENVVLTAMDTTDSLTLASTPTVAFQTPAPSASTSTVASQSPTSPADDQTQIEITVTINDQFGNPLAAKLVTLAPDAASSAEVHPITNGNTSVTAGTTNSEGQAVFEALDSTAEVVTFTATDTTDGLVITPTATVTFTAGAADPTSRFSTVAALPVNPPANGTAPSTVTVTLTDVLDNPLSGKSIQLKALNGNSQIATSTATTNSAGQALFTVTDATAEVVTYQATDVTDGNQVFSQQAVVTFGNPPAPPPVPAFCSVVATPASVPADGSTTSTISILLYDGNGNAVPGKVVTLTALGGNSTVTTINGTTDDTGAALFTVTDSTAESLKYRADDTTDGVDLNALLVTVTFTASNATTTTTTTAPGGTTTTTAPATTTTTGGGSTTTTTTGGDSTTTTTAAGSSDVATAGDSSGDDSDSSGGTGSPSLAFTGASTSVIWIALIGGIFVSVGTIGRRRTKVAR